MGIAKMLKVRINYKKEVIKIDFILFCP